MYCVLTSSSSVVRFTALCLCATCQRTRSSLQDTGVLLAFWTSLIIFCIVSSSYGKVEDFDVKTSGASIMGVHERLALDQFMTHRRNHVLGCPKAHHRQVVEADDPQKRLERVTSESYPKNSGVRTSIRQDIADSPIKGLQSMFCSQH
jgi:hypothetical protein